MYPNGQQLEQLSKQECLRLLASVPVGRIIYTLQALPAVAVVNFALNHGSVVFRVDGGGSLETATRHAVVAFEADDLDPDTRCGWSVTVVGNADEVTDIGEIAALSALGLEPWAPGGHEHFIKIKPEIVTGRRIHAAPA
jgi:nitroimidazol reductase NimA-like FMN-containing flavoprotein (pyridoxamine 5'-phosphate oxidase superfamily)